MFFFSFKEEEDEKDEIDEELEKEVDANGEIALENEEVSSYILYYVIKNAR